MTKHPFVSYLNKLSIFSIGVCFIIMLLWLFVSGDYLRHAPYYLVMYYIVTLGFWTFLYYAPKKGIIKFEQAYLISKTAKLIIYAIVFAVVLLVGIEKNVKFAIAYLLLYLVFLVFDTLTTIKLAKTDKNTK
ncbi:MAG: hypothetical protein IJ250_08140 [Bacteroidales bacterium]|nr:hypothetical protein [Bacteroidales bacterium]